MYAALKSEALLSIYDDMLISQPEDPLPHADVLNHLLPGSGNLSLKAAWRQEEDRRSGSGGGTWRGCS